MTCKPTITVSLETAALIDAYFLPVNPNKLRAEKGKPNIVAACHEFRSLVRSAQTAEAAIAKCGAQP